MFSYFKWMSIERLSRSGYAETHHSIVFQTAFLGDLFENNCLDGVDEWVCESVEWNHQNREPADDSSMYVHTRQGQNEQYIYGNPTRQVGHDAH